MCELPKKRTILTQVGKLPKRIQQNILLMYDVRQQLTWRHSHSEDGKFFVKIAQNDPRRAILENLYKFILYYSTIDLLCTRSPRPQYSKSYITPTHNNNGVHLQIAYRTIYTKKTNELSRVGWYRFFRNGKLMPHYHKNAEEKPLIHYIYYNDTDDSNRILYEKLKYGTFGHTECLVINRGIKNGSKRPLLAFIDLATWTTLYKGCTHYNRTRWT